jgi:hypothetical protein
MPEHDRILEPWYSFLNELDKIATETNATQGSRTATPTSTRPFVLQD